MSNRKVDKLKREAEHSTTALLLTLEMARERGDFKQAAACQRRLRARGVEVRYKAGTVGGDRR